MTGTSLCQQLCFSFQRAFPTSDWYTYVLRLSFDHELPTHPQNTQKQSLKNQRSMGDTLSILLNKSDPSVQSHSFLKYTMEKKGRRGGGGRERTGGTSSATTFSAFEV